MWMWRWLVFVELFFEMDLFSATVSSTVGADSDVVAGVWVGVPPCVRPQIRTPGCTTRPMTSTTGTAGAFLLTAVAELGASRVFNNPFIVLVSLFFGVR